MAVDHLLATANAIYVVLETIRCDHSSPSTLKCFPKPFHCQEIMIKTIVLILFAVHQLSKRCLLSFLQGIGIRIRKKVRLQYSIMTEVMLQEHVELVNIIEIVQGSLSKNFSILLKRLNHHDAIFSKIETQIQVDQITTLNRISDLETQLAHQNNSHLEKIQELLDKINAYEEKYNYLSLGIDESKVGLKRLNEQLFNTQLQFEEKGKVKENDLNVVSSRLQILALEQNRINEEINKKENKVQAERLIKETQVLRDKHTHIEQQLKIAHHKIQKIEILNEKAERMQAKKEIDIFKEIEERVRKEIKSTLPGSITSSLPASLPPGQAASLNTIYNSTRVSQFSPNGLPFTTSQQRVSENNQTVDEVSNKRASIMVEENGVNSLAETKRTSNEAYLERVGQKVRALEVQMKEMGETVKVLSKHSGKKQLRQNKENSSEGIKEKLNEIKPEVVKLWAKLDTIQDRLSFNERKLEEKLRSISDLAAVIKQNNISRLQEKLKNMQTEIFTSLKELRGKLDTKLNQIDYDKYCQHLQERLTQINDLIYLKSDKLEVKKALLFLESKIKEIILVISEDEQNEKDALLTKKQLKCISCDKELDKFSGIVSSPKGNWDGLPYKDHPPQILGRFGMTNFGSLAKKIKKLEGKDLPVLNKRNVNQSFQNNS